VSDNGAKSEKPIVPVTIAGREYRVRSEASVQELQRVASYLDDTMVRISERTGAVDSVELAMLTALNLAREVLALREQAGSTTPPAEIAALIERVESAVAAIPTAS